MKRLLKEKADLPNIPETWCWMSFPEATELISTSGKKLKKGEYSDTGDYPVIDQGEDFIGGYTDEAENVIKVDDPLIIFGDHTKCIKFVDFPFVPGADGIKVISPKEIYHPKCLYYFLKYLPLPDKGYSRHFKYLKKSFIPVPPLSEQVRIVAKIEELFSKLDSGVSELQKGTERLKQYRLSLLKAAFEGKLSKQARTENGWGVAWDFEEHEDPPDILEIPPEWRWIEVGAAIASLRNGIYKPKEYYNDDGIASLRMYNIEDGQIVWKDIKRMELTDEELEKYRLEPGDLLVNRVNSRELVGKAAAIPEGLEECVFESKNIRVKPTEAVQGEYLGHWFYLFRKRHFMSQVKQTVGQATVTQTQIKQMPLPLAPIAEQDEILKKIERQESILSDIQQQLSSNLTRAERLRQSILKRAFEGNLVPQDSTEEPSAPDGGDPNLEPGKQTTLSEVTSDVE